jgi:hypothetical protein
VAVGRAGLAVPSLQGRVFAHDADVPALQAAAGCRAKANQREQAMKRTAEAWAELLETLGSPVIPDHMVQVFFSVEDDARDLAELLRAMVAEREAMIEAISDWDEDILDTPDTIAARNARRRAEGL